MVGAGGKTTLVYRLADEARSAGWRVLVTTTTHMGTLPEATTGPVLVEALAYPDATGYLTVDAGTYPLEIRAAGDEAAALSLVVCAVWLWREAHRRSSAGAGNS